MAKDIERACQYLESNTNRSVTIKSWAERGIGYGSRPWQERLRKSLSYISKKLDDGLLFCREHEDGLWNCHVVRVCLVDPRGKMSRAVAEIYLNELKLRKDRRARNAKSQMRATKHLASLPEAVRRKIVASAHPDVEEIQGVQRLLLL